MAAYDAGAIAQLAVEVELLTPEQIDDAFELLGPRKGDPQPLLRLLERKGLLTPWQSKKLLKGEKDGYFLGGYRLLYKIASGTFGRVFRGDDPRSGTIVAIKVLRRKWSVDKHNIELFEREGKMGMALRHPNLVEILTVNRDESSKQYYIVMEFVEGGNLRDFLKIRKKVEPFEALGILEDATNGLLYAYGRGYTHRDIKLTNILISSQLRAKLVDFGLAGVHTTDTKDADDVQADRTVEYAGLEKATGVPPGDVRSDIFFLGCVLYELLTSRSPLPRTRNPRDRMKSERFQNIPPMGRDEVAGPPSVFRLLETMMSLEPQRRYQTPAQLLEAIREVRSELANADTQQQRTLFIVEKDPGLQAALREKFKERGYRVLLAVEPERALDRYRQQPYNALIVDAGTVGEEAVYTYERVLKEAARQRSPLVGILLLSDFQEKLGERVLELANSAVLMRPVTFKQLHKQLAIMFDDDGAE